MSHRRIRTKSNYDPQGFFQHNVAASQRKGQTIRPKSSNLSTSGVRPSATSLEAARQLIIDYHYFSYPHNITFAFEGSEVASILFQSESSPGDHYINFLNSQIFYLCVQQFHNLYNSQILPWLNGRSIGQGSHIAIHCNNFSLSAAHNDGFQITQLYIGSYVNGFAVPFVQDHSVYCQFLKWNDQFATSGLVATEYTEPISTSEANTGVYYHNWTTPFDDCAFSLQIVDAQIIQRYLEMEESTYDPALIPGTFMELYFDNVSPPLDPSLSILGNFGLIFDVYIVPA